jgi:hypothetical protein
VPDDATRESFLSLGMPAEAVIATGHPLFDRVRATRARLDAEGSTAVRRRLFPAVPAEWPIVTFLAEISDGLRSEMFRRHAAYSLTGRGGSDARTDIVIEEFLESSRALNAYRVLRLHPKNNAEEFADYRAEFDAINDDGTPHDLIYASDLVVGMTTMLLVEAVLLGRPTVSIVPDPAEAAWLPTAASGITPVVSRRDDLAGILQAGLHARLDEAAVERALPAGSVERIIEIIVAMLGRGASGNWRPEKESA